DHLVGGRRGLDVDLAAGVLLERGDPVVRLVALASLEVAGPGDDVELTLELVIARRGRWRNRGRARPGASLDGNAAARAGTDRLRGLLARRCDRHRDHHPYQERRTLHEPCSFPQGTAENAPTIPRVDRERCSATHVWRSARDRPEPALLADRFRPT